MSMVRVRCIADRMVGDDRYAAGAEYEMDADRAARYAAYFVVVGPGAAPDGRKDRRTPANKNRARPEDKGEAERPPPGGSENADRIGWPTAAGKTVLLDGTVVDEGAEDAG